MDILHKELSFQLMVEASPTALVLVNSFGKIAYVNRSVENMFLYEKQELIGQDLSILIPQRFRNNHHHLLLHFFNEPKSRQMGENRKLFALRKDQSEFPVQIGLNPIVTVEGTLILATIIDITENLKVNEQFKLVVESAPYAMLLTNEKGEIVMVNKQAEFLFGYSRKELFNQSIEILVPQRFKISHPDLRATFHKNPQIRPMGNGRNLSAMTKDQKELQVEIGLTPITLTDGNFILASVVDVTERKNNEKAFRLYTKRIEEKNKELEQITYIASHDLREPLNSISSLINIIIEDDEYKASKELYKLLSYIDQSASRMKNLVSGLLDFTRLGKNADLKQTDLNVLIRSVLNDLASMIQQSNCKIKYNKLPEISVYELEFRLLFQNLIGNAIKYRKKNIPPEIEIIAKHERFEWVFSVKDNGIGIPSDQYEKVFLLFQRLHDMNTYDGIGIGLAHCKKIVELHDGEIWVESEINKGSTFHFSIPDKK
jgi:PAS domain S-box-containing protein